MQTKGFFCHFFIPAPHRLECCCDAAEGPLPDAIQVPLHRTPASSETGGAGLPGERHAAVVPQQCLVTEISSEHSELETKEY